MKHQAFFSSKDKSKSIKVSSAAIFVRRFKSYGSQELTSVPVLNSVTR